MKNFTCNYVNKIVAAKTLILFVVVRFLFIANVFAQASLIHTSNCDFNKGNINNMHVTGGDVILPGQASGFGSWASTTSLPQALSHHKLTVWNNNVYLTGGYNPSSGYSNER